ncbi:MAG: response regulator, partial [Muribaculaceae bacterium]|nr:response regulator [Muribaculaceae bacterium]
LGMIEDKNKNINFVCESTIVIYDPSTGNSYSLPTRRLDPNMEFTEAMPLMNPATGDLWYGQLGGALIVTPDKSIVSHHVPNIVVTSVQFRGEPERTKMLNPDIIEVPAGTRDISVFFAALDYPGSDNIQYAYKLNDNDEWTYIYNANSIYLNELTPGNHKLTIRSTNSDGIWQENDRVVKIHVEPTFGESIWAKLLWAILAIGVISGLLYLYTVNRRNRMFESLHRKEHDFFIEASHRLRTPLTLIGSPVSEVLSTENLSEKGRTHLEKVHRNALEMLDLVDKMLVKGFEQSDIVDERTIDKEENSTHGSDNTHDDEIANPGNDKEITILIVEDNTDLRHFLRDILESQYNVAMASNGKIGLEMAQKIQPDFIVTDVTMPEMDGLTMVHKIKQDKTLSHIPIIVLSAKSSFRDRIEGLKEGIDDYITKPFSATYLRQRIANIIAQRLILQQSYFERLGQEMKSTIAPSSNLLPEQPAEAPQQLSTAANEPTTNPENASTQFDYRLESPSITDSDQEMMAKLLKFIESRISDESLKIEELAESVNMGRTVFYGKIKALVGMSPSDFVRKLRMQRAEELIVKSKMNFSQIAYNVGFSDPKYFTKCFKKETGMTPSEYRQKSAPAE